MKTKLLMTSSALFCGIIGTLLLFLPIEIAEYLGVEPTIITILCLKILSAIYLGFGILNWTAKGTLIGGIYNKPIVLGNLLHFAVGAIELIKVITPVCPSRQALRILAQLFQRIEALLNASGLQ